MLPWEGNVLTASPTGHLKSHWYNNIKYYSKQDYTYSFFINKAFCYIIFLGDIMWRFIVILTCKFINKISKLTGHEGSVIGGYYALKLDKNILKKIKLPKYVIGITGSSGKSSSTELMYNILTRNGYTTVYNKEGSNTINAIT